MFFERLFPQRVPNSSNRHQNWPFLSFLKELLVIPQSHFEPAELPQDVFLFSVPLVELGAKELDWQVSGVPHFDELIEWLVWQHGSYFDPGLREELQLVLHAMAPYIQYFLLRVVFYSEHYLSRVCSFMVGQEYYVDYLLLRRLQDPGLRLHCKPLEILVFGSQTRRHMLDHPSPLAWHLFDVFESQLGSAQVSETHLIEVQRLCA